MRLQQFFSRVWVSYARVCVYLRGKPTNLMPQTKLPYIILLLYAKKDAKEKDNERKAHHFVLFFFLVYSRTHKVLCTYWIRVAAANGDDFVAIQI